MKHLSRWLIGALLAVPALPGTAAPHNYPKAFPEDRTVEIAPAADGKAAAEVKLPPVPTRKGATPVLVSNIRMKHTSPNGWNHSAGLTVNGKTVTSHRISGEQRLLFRGDALESDYAKEPKTPWWRSNRLLIFFAQDGIERMSSHVVAPKEEGYGYYLELGDMLKSDGENLLRFDYALKQGALKNDPPLLIKNLNVVYIPDDELKQLQPRLAPTREKDPAGRLFDNAFAVNQSLTIAPPETGLAYGRCELPPVPEKQGFIPVLRFDARLNNSTLSGWHHYVTVTVNGKRLDKLTAAGEPRLLFRGETVVSTYESWSAAKGREWWNAGLLFAFFAPEKAEQVDPHLISAREEGFVFYLDVSDCIHQLKIGADDRLEGNEPNVIEFGNSAKRPLVLKDINIVYLPAAMLEKARPKAKLTRYESGKGAASIRFPGGLLQVNEAGGMEIVAGDDRFFLAGRISYPAKPRMRFNLFGIEKTEGEPGWKPVVKQVSPEEISVSAQGKQYRVERRITKAGHRFNVVDTIANLTGGDIGFAYYEDISANQEPRSDYRLAGLSNARGAGYDAGPNPSLFATGDHGAAVGLLTEDTLSRCKLEMIAKGNVLSVGVPGMGLPKGESLVREWAIYPMPKEGRYYDFVNQVRRDWDVNMTLIGPSISGEYEGWPPTLRPAFKQIRPWFEYATGAMLNRDEFIAAVKPKMEQHRKAFPDIWLLGSLETNLVPLNCEDLPWKDELPLTYGDRSRPDSQYGIYATKSATEKIDAISPLKDSILRSADGRAMLDSYFIYANQPTVNLMVQPELGNARYKQILEQIDFLIDRVGFNAIYMDQFPPKPREGYRYDRWAGRSVTLAPDGTIATKYYSYAYTGVSARMAIIEKIRSKGCLFRCNGSPVSKEEQKMKIFCFHEMENSRFDPMLFLDSKPPETISQVSAHLSPSPAVANLRPIRYTKDYSLFPRVVMRGTIMALRNGVMPYYYNVGPEKAKVNCEIANHFFPFTPVELNEGFLVGRERTITAVSGDFKVAGKKQPKVCYFDRDGYPKSPAQVTVTGTPDNWLAAVKLHDWNEVVVLEVQD